jgi:Flp pilus assembly CpaF family ATPase
VSGSPVGFNDVDRDLVADLARRVGEKLVSWTQQEEQRSTTAVAPETRRAYAVRLVRDELQTIDRNRLNLGEQPLSEQDTRTLSAEVVATMFGFGGLQRHMDRRDWTDLYIHGVQGRLRLLDGSKVSIGPVARNQEEVRELIRQLASTAGRTARQFNETNPLLSMRLPTGERLSATIGVSDQIELAIRRQTVSNLTLDELCDKKSFTPLARDFLKAAVIARRNIVVAGPTGAGKTTMLSALCAEIGPNETIVTIEDAAELNLRSDRHPDVISLEAREANIEGIGAVTMDDLAKHALRMSPDRVVCGEVRGVEVAAMCSAMSQGNDGSMCTVHAAPGQAPERLRMYMTRAYPQSSMAALSDTVAQALHFVVHVGVLRSGERRVVSIREVTGAEGETFMQNEVFRFDGYELVPTGALSEDHRTLLGDTGFAVALLGGRR